MPLEILSPSDQVAIHLRQQLSRGHWSGKLPGTPALAKELDCDRKTIIGALKQLEDQGVLKSQGSGRPRIIIAPKNKPKGHLTIRLIPYDGTNRQNPMILNLMKLIEEEGHEASMTRSSLVDLDMNVEKVSQMVEADRADAWLVVAASAEILQWFANQKRPAFAIFGRRRKVKLGSTGPDKVKAMRKAVARLLELGHQRIVWLAKEERVSPTPGYLETQFLKTLQNNGIIPGAYHLPHWQNNPGSFHECLDRLFEHTPPTALIADQAELMIAAQQHLGQKNIIAPRDASIICCDDHPLFNWLKPQVSHISWNTSAAANQVIYWVQKLARGKNDLKATYISAEFIEGGTIGPAPNRSM